MCFELIGIKNRYYSMNLGIYYPFYLFLFVEPFFAFLFSTVRERTESEEG